MDRGYELESKQRPGAIPGCAWLETAFTPMNGV